MTRSYVCAEFLLRLFGFHFCLFFEGGTRIFFDRNLTTGFRRIVIHEIWFFITLGVFVGLYLYVVTLNFFKQSLLCRVAIARLIGHAV
ncbi:hypothetical protein D9M69_618180 [compost metagenome]